jgi:Cu(I)/Ag(I) efflux system membrane fusion protein/cobalt-zinc-cadmium efflux system membrane fusion protein
MKNYRTGFLVALTGNIVLIVVAATLWLHYRPAKLIDAKSLASNTPASAADSSTFAAASESEAQLVPVHISAQRLQSIGATTGKVERKLVEDELRTTGNVAVDETRLAYVQVRFPGFIQKVFVDATYQYVRKGQPLCTIYSPDLAATEREYLVAKQNQQGVAQSAVPCVE